MRRLYESAKAHGVSEVVLQLLLSESKVMGNEYIEKVRDTRRRDHDHTRISFDD
jgi:capsid portal protein